MASKLVFPECSKDAMGPWGYFVTNQRAAVSVSASPFDRCSDTNGLRDRQTARWLRPNRSASCCFDRGDIDFSHCHHRLERALRGRTIRIGRCFHQHARRDLPSQAPFVFAPSACALGTSISDNRVPVTIGLGLILGEDLKRKRFTVLESRAAIQPEAGHSHHRKLNSEHLPLFASRVVAGCAVNGCYGTVRKRFGVEPRRLFCCPVIPKTNHILSHLVSPSLCQLDEPTLRTAPTGTFPIADARL